MAARHASPIPLCPAALLCLTLLVGLLTAPGHAGADVLLKESFSVNSHNFAAASWQAKYCADGWTTALNGGVMAKTDHGCSCGTGCDFGVYTQGANKCINSQATDNILVRGDTKWTNYSYRVRFRNADNDTLGVVFRYKNTANYYAVWLSRDIAPSVSGGCDSKLVGSRLVRVQSTSSKSKATQLASSKLTYQVGKTHMIEVLAVGSQLTVHFDANANGKFELPGEVLFSVKDATHKSGAIGLYAYQNGTGETPCYKGGCWFDDVIVQTPPQVEPPKPTDTDKDGKPDGLDNCPKVPNPDQKNTDGDKLGDACDDDADGDGIGNVKEAQLGGHPLDRDSDDDGVLDGDEALPEADTDGDGKANIIDPDSDGDGLNDGLEAGVVKPDKDTDLSKGHFVEDLDPTTHTSTVKKDTDGDGRDDGVEDANGNGRVDKCESNPLVVDKPPCQPGVDAGTGFAPDVGQSDAGTSSSGGASDAGTSGGSAGAGPDTVDGGGLPKGTAVALKTVGDDDGGCRAVPTHRGGAGWLLMLALGALVLIGVRRRATNPASSA